MVYFIRRILSFDKEFIEKIKVNIKNNKIDNNLVFIRYSYVRILILTDLLWVFKILKFYFLLDYFC